MRKLFVVIFLFLSNLLYSQDLINMTVHGGNLSPLQNLIRIEQLRNFSRDDLRILRNTIYAKYGYRFSSIDLQNHFSQFSWYNGVSANVEDKLTTLDKENIELIQRIERNFPENYDSINELIGHWYHFGAVSAEGINNIEELYRQDNIIILPNGIYVLDLRMYNTGIFYGLWSLRNDIFETIPIGIHKPYFFPTYERVENFSIGSMKFNNGNYHLACSLFGRGSWAKE